jgi:AraC-like DNA-binding protein
MPMAEIALNAGFSSLRQFNHAMRTIAGQSPTDLRRLRDSTGISTRSIVHPSIGQHSLDFLDREQPPAWN